MKLKEFIEKHGFTQRELARALSLHYRYLCGVVNGEYIPSRKLAKNIEIFTKGQVTATELLFPGD